MKWYVVWKLVLLLTITLDLADPGYHGAFSFERDGLFVQATTRPHVIDVELAPASDFRTVATPGGPGASGIAPRPPCAMIRTPGLGHPVRLRPPRSSLSSTAPGRRDDAPRAPSLPVRLFA